MPFSSLLSFFSAAVAAAELVSLCFEGADSGLFAVAAVLYASLLSLFSRGVGLRRTRRRRRRRRLGYIFRQRLWLLATHFVPLPFH